MNYIDESVQLAFKKKSITTILENIKNIDIEADNIIKSLKEKDESIKKCSQGVQFSFDNPMNSSWISKFQTTRDFQCPEGYIMTGIGFQHPAGKNYTYQESFLVHCTKIELQIK